MIHLRLVNDTLYEARADFEKLKDIDILSNNIEIDDSAFSNCDKLVIHASEKSNAHRFAIKHNIPFIATAI